MDTYILTESFSLGVMSTFFFRTDSVILLSTKKKNK